MFACLIVRALAAYHVPLIYLVGPVCLSCFFFVVYMIFLVVFLCAVSIVLLDTPVPQLTEVWQTCVCASRPTQR